jgi:hypothetical protein
MNCEAHLNVTTFEKGFKRKHPVNNEPIEPPRESIKWRECYAEWRNGCRVVSVHRGDMPPNMVKNRRVSASPNK